MSDTAATTQGTATITQGTVSTTTGNVTNTGSVGNAGSVGNIINSGTTAASTTTTTQTTGDGKIAWGEKWREELSGGDAKKLSQLQRYASPTDYVNATFALRQKMDSGELKAAATKPPENATPEQMTEWRKENGIPEKPEGYLEGLPDGVVIGDQDKKMFGTFAEAMHKANMPPAAVHAALGWYYSNFENIEAEQVTADKQTLASSEDAMRSAWGADYRTNTNMISSYLSTLAGQDGKNVVADALMSARAGDGTPLLHMPQMLGWLATLAREAGGAITVPAAQGMTQAATVESRINEIEAMMKPTSPQYRNYLSNPAIEAEYRKLIEARERLKARAA